MENLTKILINLEAINGIIVYLGVSEYGSQIIVLSEIDGYKDN